MQFRKVEYLSPTCIEKYTKNKTEFYFQYLCPNRPPRIPQTIPMALGAAFDAFVKSFLHEAIFGKGKDPKFDLKTLFEAQVETQNRDIAWKDGQSVFNEYKRQGALADIMLELSKAVGEPRFELAVSGVVNGYREGITTSREGVMLLGKPDLFFINSMGAHVVLDWKVNGFYSDWGASPHKGYVKIRNDLKNPNGSHKDAYLMMQDGIMINVAEYFELIQEDWARQLAIYGWLCGEEIGHEFIVAVDQICFSKTKVCRVASHRSRVSKTYQWKLFALCQEIWEIVHSDHIFRDRSREESLMYCETLDKQASYLCGEGSEEDQWFAKATRV